MWKTRDQFGTDLNRDTHFSSLKIMDDQAYERSVQSTISIVSVNDRLGHAAVMELFDASIKVAQEREKANDTAN